jgi:hypothetical protein
MEKRGEERRGEDYQTTWPCSPPAQSSGVQEQPGSISPTQPNTSPSMNTSRSSPITIQPTWASSSTLARMVATTMPCTISLAAVLDHPRTRGLDLRPNQ